MSKLLLFTSSFPFGEYEAYLETEIIFLAKKFDKITIYPFFYKDKNMEMRKIPLDCFFFKQKTAYEI